MKKLLILTVFLLASAAFADAPRQYTAKFSEVFPALDGKISGDPAWENVPWSREPFFVHREKTAPKLGTRFKALYTRDAVYVALECAEPDPSKLKKVYNFNEFWIYDTIELFFLPNPGELIQLIANYESMTQDVISGNVAKRANFQTGWKSAAAKGGDAWTLEICVPFYLLGAAPSASALSIPFNVCRNSTTSKERSTWNFQTGAFSNVKCFGRLVCAAAPQKARAEIAESVKTPHWISLAARWKSIRLDPAWADVFKRFPEECAALEKLFAAEADYARNARLFRENLSKIESFAKERESMEKTRIRKRLYGE